VLAPLDIAVIVGWLTLSLLAGLWFSRRASTSTEDFFAAGRRLPWWVVGTSMVATTFAADTPLAVTGWVATKGIAENWIWWTFGLTGACAVFLFAPLWRRSGVLTDAEFVELRYGPVAGRWLRRFKALWFGVFWNALILAWVIKAMVKISGALLGVDPATPVAALWPALGPIGGVSVALVVVAVLFTITVVYTAASGLWGVVATDVLQFGLAMVASVALAAIAWSAVGGLDGMRAGFAQHGFDWDRTTALFPSDGAPDGATAGLVVLLGLLWWSGTNVDGGGYLAQRLFSARDDRHALWAYLWFTVAHVVLRPWPWIIVALAGMAMLGPIDDAETYYPRMMTALLPAGALGLMVASFLAAFMSTIDTHLNWGASLLVHDLWTPFAKWVGAPTSEVAASRISVVLLALGGAATSFLITDIGAAWKLAISVTAGLGAAYAARWLWWRASAWSEIGAMASAAVLTTAFGVLDAAHPATAGEAGWAWLGALPAGWLRFPFSAGATVVLSLPIWIGLTLVTPPPSAETLRAFADKVRPGGPGWPVALRGDGGPSLSALAGIASSVVAIYGALLGFGWLMLGHLAWAVPALIIGAAGTVAAGYAIRAASARAPETPA
jgi:solute:Na+ symporter, SSS family